MRPRNKCSEIQKKHRHQRRSFEPPGNMDSCEETGAATVVKLGSELSKQKPNLNINLLLYL